MNAETRPSAMRLKAGAMRPPPEIGALTPGKALRVAVAQAAEEVAALEAAPGPVDELRTTRDRVVEGLSEAALLVLLEGPASRFGLMVLDPQAVAALIEIQTTGRVVPRPADVRPPTRTDAIICADFIDRVLEVFEAQTVEAELEIAPALAGFRYAIALADPRAVGMTLEELPYRRFHCAVDLGRGAKSGAIELVLPFDPPGRGARRGAEAVGFTAALETRVLASRAELGVTLMRREMRLSEVMALEPGALIAVPRGALGRVAVEDLSGRVVAHGRLGQVGGHRAVRLVDQPVARDDEPSGEADPRGMSGPDLPGPGGPDILPGPGSGTAVPVSADAAGLGELGGVGAADEATGEFAGLPGPEALARLGQGAG